jgi:hypothetical protein
MGNFSQTTLEELLGQLDQITGSVNQTFELRVPEHLTFRGRPTQMDVAMAVLLDKILSKGYEPDGFKEVEGGKVYMYKKCSGQ